MIPFIDLLMVTIAFLLITAVWVTNSRINADAQVPGPPNPNEILTPQTPEKVLNLQIMETEFVWKQGRDRRQRGEGDAQRVGTGGNKVVRFPDLAKKLETEWNTQGGHKDPSDKKIDQAILATDNRTPFKEIVGVLDALYATKRDMKFADGTTKKVPVFNMTFSVH